ncbi:MAG: hypothetical protein R3C12_18290 [Planctomycetaceae bacterium]
MNRQVYDAQVVCTRVMPLDLAILRIKLTLPFTSLSLLEADEVNRLRVTQPAWALPKSRKHSKRLFSGKSRLPPHVLKSARRRNPRA